MPVPTFVVSVGGTDVSANFRSRLIEMRATDNTGKESDTIEIQLSDEYGILAEPEPGAWISASIGWDGATEPIGEYAVESVTREGGGDKVWTMNISGKAAALSDTIKSHRTEAHAETTVGDIVSKVAGRNGFQPAVSPSMASRKVTYLGQSEESDMHLLARLARREGAIFSVKDRRIVFNEMGAGETTSGQSMGSVSIALTDIIEWRYKRAGRSDFGKVKGKYLDRDSGKEEELEVPVPNAGSAESEFVVRNPYKTKEEAQRGLENRGREISRDGGSLSLTLHGRTDLKAGGKATVSGLPGGASGSWDIERVTQTLNQSGWRTEAEFKRETSGGSGSGGNGEPGSKSGSTSGSSGSGGKTDESGFGSPTF